MSVAETFILDTTINLAVFGDMELRLSTQYIAREGDHNSATFRIVRQPAALQSLACRAEIETQAGKNYYLVENGEFQLTQDISVPGPGRMQLVYSDGVDVMRKTSIAHFTVMPSINAVDPSDPDFQDGLAQLQAAAFTAVVDPPPGGDVATFFNLGGNPVAVLRFPPAAVGGDLTEARADTLYLRLNGANRMAGSVFIDGNNRGVIFAANGTAPGIYADTNGFLVLRRPQGNAEVTIENNDGSTGSRSPIVTQASGDIRYVQLSVADLRYLLTDGGNAMTNDLRLIPSAGVDAPIGITIGGRQARVRWENALILTRGQANEPVQIENNNGSFRSDILTQIMGDLRYVQPPALEPYLLKAGGQMTGPLITQTGSSNTNPGIGIGDNSSGFWRTSTYLICIMGGQTVWQSNVTEMLFGVRINAAGQLITNVSDAVSPQDAVNRRTMDSAIAAVPRPNSRTYLTNTVELLNTTPQILIDQVFPVANNNPRTITVTVFPTFEGGTPSAFYDLIYTCSVAPLIEARSTVYPTAGAYMQSPVRFAATVTPSSSQIQVQVAVRLNAAATGPLTIVGSSETRRSYVTIEEQQN